MNTSKQRTEGNVMNMQAIKNQVVNDCPQYDTETVDCVARELARVAMNKYCVFRHRGATYSEIYHQTIDALTDTGYSFDLAKIVVAYVVATRG